MGVNDLEALLRPVSEEAHCGPDLDAAGDPAYVELGVITEWRDAKYVGEQELAFGIRERGHRDEQCQHQRVLHHANPVTTM